MTKYSQDADSKEDGAPYCKFSFDGKIYSFPTETLLEIANEIESRADVFIDLYYCEPVIALVLKGLRNEGWTVLPSREP
jgi:hypothetical protein